jgi:hypothetical protein
MPLASADSVSVPPTSVPFLAGRRVPYFAAALLIVLGLLEAWRMVALENELGAARATLRAWQGEAAEAAARASLTGCRLSLLEPRDPAYAQAKVAVAWNGQLHEGMVALEALPPAPTGSAYQLWVLDPHEPAPLSGGLLSTGGGGQHFSVHALQTEEPGFAVSLEPAKGSVEPTGALILALAPPE